MAQAAGQFTTAMLTALTAAIAQGVRTVSYGDRRVEYASIGEMMTLRDRMIGELRQNQDGPMPSMTRRTGFLRR